VLESVADDVQAAFEANITLNGACEYSIPSSGVWSFGFKETPVRIFELIITSTVHVRRDTGTLV